MAKKKKKSNTFTIENKENKHFKTKDFDLPIRLINQRSGNVVGCVGLDATEVEIVKNTLNRFEEIYEVIK